MTSSSGAAIGHRIVDVEKLTEAINEASKQHTLLSPGCKDMQWLIPEETEEIRGLAVSAHFKCKNCDFETTALKLKKLNRKGQAGELQYLIWPYK